MPEAQRLARDNEPAIMAANGVTPVTKVLTDTEYEYMLIEKLAADQKNLALADTTEQMEDRLAEVLEDVEALAIHISSLKRVREIQAKKYAEYGGFTNRILLERTE